MLRLIWALSVHTRYFLRRYMPTNILLDTIRTRRGLRWGLPAMLLAIPYLYAANLCVQLLTGGGPGWLHLLVLPFICNVMSSSSWDRSASSSCSAQASASTPHAAASSGPTTGHGRPVGAGA